MGKKARELVGKSVNKVLKDLVAVYSDEWLAHYQFWHLAQVLRGVDADTLRGQLLKQAGGELEHAGEIAKRIVQLGGSPPAAWDAIARAASCKPRPASIDYTDLKGAIKYVLEAERCVIDSYNKLMKKYRDVDHITYELAEELLQDELEEEELWENFLSRV